MIEHVFGASWFVPETEKRSAKEITYTSPFFNAPFFRLKGYDTGARALSSQNNFHVADTNAKVPYGIRNRTSTLRAYQWHRHCTLAEMKNAITVLLYRTALIDELHALVINITSLMQACKKYCGTWTNGVLKSLVHPATCIIRLKISCKYRGKLTNATYRASTQSPWAGRFNQSYDVREVATLVAPDSSFETWQLQSQLL